MRAMAQGTAGVALSRRQRGGPGVVLERGVYAGQAAGGKGETVILGRSRKRPSATTSQHALLGDRGGGESFKQWCVE